MQKSNNEQGGSFLSGLTLGLFAGAASYYLLGTKDGKKIREKLKTEWEEARGSLPKVAKELEFQRQEFSFPNFFCKTLQAITEGECLCGQCDKVEKKAQKRITRKKKTTAKKFKGV